MAFISFLAYKFSTRSSKQQNQLWGQKQNSCNPMKYKNGGQLKNIKRRYETINTTLKPIFKQGL